jgi:hypothetical protein
MCICCINKPTDLLEEHMTIKRFVKRMNEAELNKHEAATIKNTLETLDENDCNRCPVGKDQIARLRERQFELSRML